MLKLLYHCVWNILDLGKEEKNHSDIEPEPNPIFIFSLIVVICLFVCLLIYFKTLKIVITSFEIQYEAIIIIHRFGLIYNAFMH